MTGWMDGCYLQTTPTRFSARFERNTRNFSCYDHNTSDFLAWLETIKISVPLQRKKTRCTDIQTATDRHTNQRIMRYRWITKHMKHCGNQASAMQ